MTPIGLMLAKTFYFFSIWCLLGVAPGIGYSNKNSLMSFNTLLFKK